MDDIKLGTSLGTPEVDGIKRGTSIVERRGRRVGELLGTSLGAPLLGSDDGSDDGSLLG